MIIMTLKGAQTKCQTKKILTSQDLYTLLHLNIIIVPESKWNLSNWSWLRVNALSYNREKWDPPSGLTAWHSTPSCTHLKWLCGLMRKPCTCRIDWKISFSFFSDIIICMGTETGYFRWIHKTRCSFIICGCFFSFFVDYQVLRGKDDKCVTMRIRKLHMKHSPCTPHKTLIALIKFKLKQSNLQPQIDLPACRIAVSYSLCCCIWCFYPDPCATSCYIPAVKGQTVY